MKRFNVALLFLMASASGWPGGSMEGAGGSARGKYLAGGGTIIPADQVIVSTYIAGTDYRYPRPDAGIGVNLYTGHKQVSMSGQEEILHIGIQAPATEFADLPPMNLAFVIDHSGSMDDQDKLDWVKKAFNVFIGKVREKDFVSLVIFNSAAEVLYPSTRMDSAEKRRRFQDAVSSVTPLDGTNLLEGLKAGYQQAMANYRGDYNNRVLFLTDGQDNEDHSKAILEMADSYRKMGINVSTIGLGADIDLKLLNDIAVQGGGSSRFLSDMKEMEAVFGSELDRTVVSAARDLSMSLELSQGVELLETWGYGNKAEGGKVSYTLPTLHQRDYETILARLKLPARDRAGRMPIATFSVSYKDLQGADKSLGPFPVEVEYVAGDAPVTGFSDGMVLHSGTILHFAQALIRIAQAYYAGSADTNAINSLRGALFQKLGEEEKKKTDALTLTSPQIAAAEASLRQKLQSCLDMTVAMKKELENARLRLDDRGFDDEIAILDKYLQVFGKDLSLKDEDVARAGNDREIAPPVPQRTLEENVRNLLREIVLNLPAGKGGAIAVSGFSMKREKQPPLCALLDEMGSVELSRAPGLTLVERGRMDAVLKEQELALSDLADTGKAITVGKVLSARYILTGSVIEMPGSVVIFARVVDVETAEVESAAQVIVPKDAQVSGLL